MSIRTIYKCDRCAGEQDTPAQFWTVGVFANCQSNSRDFVSSEHKMHVCRPCLESLGIYVRKQDMPTGVPPPTLEDLIREIVATEFEHSYRG